MNHPKMGVRIMKFAEAIQFALLITLTLINVCPSAAAQGSEDNTAVLETYWVYRNGAKPGHHLSPWNMQWSEIDAGQPRGKYLWLNSDWQARPWAGISFRRDSGEPMELTEDWLQKGFFRFLITGGLDRYGSPNAELSFQLRLEADGCSYQRLRSRFIDRGRGLDEDPATWQEVFVPLSYWTNLKPGLKVNGLSIQCVHQPMRAFGFDDVGLVLYDRRPAWIERLDNVDVAQPWVIWPTYDELPDILKADKHPPQIQNGRFVWPDGRRAFLINPYLREDPRIVYWGGHDRESIPPDHGLYDPEIHGWIYEDIPTAETLCRLGFNSFSATMPSQPWWDAVGYSHSDNGHDAGRLPAYAQEVGLPFYVDLVCWPWTLGRPAAQPEETTLPASAFTEGKHHWTPYRITGTGRDAWLQMWKLYAERYRDAGVNTVAVELMNEPAYTDVSEDHRAEFVTWLKGHYADVASLNRTWGTEYQAWDEAAAFDSPDDLRHIPGLFFDYDSYLAERFTDLIADGVELVSEILPDALVGIQPMGGYALSPREAVWKHLLVEHETVVLTPTGGGRWTSGSSASKPGTDVLESPMAAAPLENELLLALAGDKMVFDNETYLRGQTALEVRNRLWEHVLSGLDGLSVFSWSKRGWTWWKTRADMVTEADKYPYSALIPLARRTDALRGIHDFAAELQPIANRLLPKPWGPVPKIGLLYSWDNARRRVYEPELPDKTPAYYAALKYTHANLRVIPSHKALENNALAGLDVIIAGGVRYVEKALPSELEEFVRAGGILIVGEEPMALDLYGHPFSSEGILGVNMEETGNGDHEIIPLPTELASAELSGDIRLESSLRTLKCGTEASVLVSDSRGRPVVTKRLLDNGLVYVQGADLIGYPLAKLLWAILADAAAAKETKIPSSWRLAEIHDTATDQLAANILLSRRSHEDYHVFMLVNRDGYNKTVRMKVNLPAGDWRVRDAISDTTLNSPADRQTWSSQQLMDNGLKLSIGAGEPVVIMIGALCHNMEHIMTPYSSDRPRLLVLTDIGGDPDDEQSLVRLLIYSSEFDIEGIIPQLWLNHSGRHGKLSPDSQMDLVRDMIGLYGQVRENLAKHADSYPTESYLKSVLKRGTVDVPHPDSTPNISGIIGTGKDTEGSEWIISVVDKPDNRPVDVNVWGGPADLAQALWKVRSERGQSELNSFVSKIRVHAIGDQDNTGPWIRDNFPDLFYILDHARDGDKMHSCYRGMFIGGDESLTSREWIDKHVRHHHGPLGEFYPPETWTGPNPNSALKEGDTPSWFYFYQNGLNVPSEPEFGGWGGRFSPNGKYYQDVEDTVGDETSGRATVWRWRPAFQNEFQARMDWCVKDYPAANHNPVAIVNGHSSRSPLMISAAPGDAVDLDASESSDPDGDGLSYRWWLYGEAGTYESIASTTYSTSANASLRVPPDAAGRTIHVILEIRDDGLPPLTGYRRVIIEVEE